MDRWNIGALLISCPHVKFVDTSIKFNSALLKCSSAPLIFYIWTATDRFDPFGTSQKSRPQLDQSVNRMCWSFGVNVANPNQFENSVLSKQFLMQHHKTTLDKLNLSAVLCFPEYVSMCGSERAGLCLPRRAHHLFSFKRLGLRDTEEVQYRNTRLSH